MDSLQSLQLRLLSKTWPWIVEEYILFMVFLSFQPFNKLGDLSKVEPQPALPPKELV